MPISSPDGKPKSLNTRTVATDSAFLCIALMLSLAETLAFPAGILPIPGAKIGLANAAVLLCASLAGKAHALIVSMCRVLLMFILFGNATSFIYSLSGSLFSFVGIFIFINNSKLSFIGKSVICAVLHNSAQILCAAVIVGPYVLFLLPAMLLTALAAGIATGMILNIIFDKTKKIISFRLRI